MTDEVLDLNYSALSPPKGFVGRALWILATPLRVVVNLVLKRVGVFILFRSGSAIGEQLGMSGVIEQLALSHQLKVVLITSYPDLFTNNPYIYFLYGPKTTPAVIWRLINWGLVLIRGHNIARFFCEKAHPSFEDFLRKTHDQSLIEVHGRHIYYPITFKDVTPKVYLSKAEGMELQESLRLPSRFWIVQSQGKLTFTKNKEWGADNFAKVVSGLSDLTWVQVGLANDARIPGCVDLRGKTPSLRKLAFVISKAQGVVCLEGLLNHMAASLKILSIVICSGLVPFKYASYPTSTLITVDKLPTCYPCMRRAPCNILDKPCMNPISPQEVINVIKSKIEQSSGELTRAAIASPV